MNLRINKWTKGESFEVFTMFILFFIIVNFSQSNYFIDSFGDSRKVQLFFFIHVISIIISIVFIGIKVHKKTSLLLKLYNLFFFKLNIPKGAKIAICVVVAGNIISIILAKPLYPFYDVGMFRWTTTFENKSGTVYKPKYYYYKDEVVQILDIRKESFYLLSEHFGLGYTHEFTFAATYHNKSQKENFEFLVSELKEQGIDTLWVGIHAVNYKTKKVWFDPDICNAININTTMDIHYGPIYIPEYQIKKCDEN